MDSFPAYIPLSGIRVVIAGDGSAAAAKARLFARSPAEVVRVENVEAATRPETYAGAKLAFICALEPGATAAAAQAARNAGALVNVVDRPHLCDFITPAVIDRGQIVGAIGTGGASPVLATLLRSDLEARWPEGLDRLADLSRALQTTVRQAAPDPVARRVYWRKLLTGPAAEAALRGDMEVAERYAIAMLNGAGSPPGVVLFLQAPADPALLTLAAVRSLSDADLVVAGDEISPDILAYVRRDADRRTAATVELLAAWAREGLTVARISPRADEAVMDALERAGVRAERLPVG